MTCCPKIFYIVDWGFYIWCSFLTRKAFENQNLNLSVCAQSINVSNINRIRHDIITNLFESTSKTHTLHLSLNVTFNDFNHCTSNLHFFPPNTHLTSQSHPLHYLGFQSPLSGTMFLYRVLYSNDFSLILCINVKYLIKTWLHK